MIFYGTICPVVFFSLFVFSIRSITVAPVVYLFSLFNISLRIVVAKYSDHDVLFAIFCKRGLSPLNSPCAFWKSKCFDCPQCTFMWHIHRPLKILKQLSLTVFVTTFFNSFPQRLYIKTYHHYFCCMAALY